MNTQAERTKLRMEKTRLQADARLKDALDSLPSTIVAIEEPEIYQHPVRARAFARTLVELSTQPAIQVVLATHSPYFVQNTEKFSALHRLHVLRGHDGCQEGDTAGCRRRRCPRRG